MSELKQAIKEGKVNLFQRDKDEKIRQKTKELWKQGSFYSERCEATMAIEPEILKQAILTGYDIEFSVDGQKYTIIPWTENGIIIGPQNQTMIKFFQMLMK